MTAKGSRSEDRPLNSVRLQQNTRDTPLGMPCPSGGRRSPASTLATSPSGLLFPRPHFRFGRLRHRLATCSGFPVKAVGGCAPGGGPGSRGSQALTSALPPARRGRLSHGERRAALAGPVHPPGHQLCRHRLPVLRVSAEVPGRPRAQGQCWSGLGLSQVITAPGNDEPTVLLWATPLAKMTQKRKQAQRGRHPASKWRS